MSRSKLLHLENHIFKLELPPQLFLPNILMAHDSHHSSFHVFACYKLPSTYFNHPIYTHMNQIMTINPSFNPDQFLCICKTFSCQIWNMFPLIPFQPICQRVCRLSIPCMVRVPKSPRIRRIISSCNSSIRNHFLTSASSAGMSDWAAEATPVKETSVPDHSNSALYNHT